MKRKWKEKERLCDQKDYCLILISLEISASKSDDRLEEVYVMVNLCFAKQGRLEETSN